MSEKVSLRFVVEEVDHIIQHTRDLEGTVDEAAVMTILQEKLPEEIAFELSRLELEKMDACNTGMMLHELYCILEARERVGYNISASFCRPGYQKDFKAPRPQPAYAVMEERNRRLRQSCVFCRVEHFNSNCNVYKTFKQRKKRAYKLGLCARCLRTGHRFKDCKIVKICYYCKKDQNSAFCERFGHQQTFPKHQMVTLPKTSKKEVSTQVTTVEIENISSKDLLEVILPVTKAKVSNSSNKAVNEEVYALLDSGSQRSFVTDRLANNSIFYFRIMTN